MGKERNFKIQIYKNTEIKNVHFETCLNKYIYFLEHQNDCKEEKKNRRHHKLYTCLQKQLNKIRLICLSHLYFHQNYGIT